MKINYFVNILFALLLISLLPGAARTQGMVLNEFSNGDSGSREYLEMVVVGPDANPNFGPVDLRGWIIDDNNGDFSCGPCSGTGIASGHIRLGYVATWSAVPTGSIIVIYNDAPGDVNLNMPAADPDDTSPADGVYIVPSSSVLLDVSTGLSCPGGNIPFGATACPGPCTGNPTYTSACYTTGGAWANAGLRNDGDAAQVRMPNGAYYHGVGYGNASSGINGGPEGLFFSGVGAGDFYMFANTITDDYRNVSNWTTATVATNGETPGAPNNAANAAWIASLQVPCILPVVYAQQLSGTATPQGNVLSWSTATEVNADKFILEKSFHPSEGFSYLGELPAYGNSSDRRSYEFTDAHPAQISYYRLRQVDVDGEENISHVVTVSNASLTAISFQTWPNPADRELRFRVEGEQVQAAELVDLTGRIIQTIHPVGATDVMQGTLDTSRLESGLYLLRIRTAGSVATRRIVCRH